MDNRAKEWFVRSGLTKAKLATASEKTEQEIGRIVDQKRRMTIAWAETLAPIFGCHPAELLWYGTLAKDPAEERLIASFRRLDSAQTEALFGLMEAFLKGKPPPGQRIPDIAPNQVAQGADISRRQLRGAAD